MRGGGETGDRDKSGTGAYLVDHLVKGRRVQSTMAPVAQELSHNTANLHLKGVEKGMEGAVG